MHVQTENIRIAYIDEIPPGQSNISFKLNVVSCLCLRVSEGHAWTSAHCRTLSAAHVYQARALSTQCLLFAVWLAFLSPAVLHKQPLEQFNLGPLKLTGFKVGLRQSWCVCARDGFVVCKGDAALLQALVVNPDGAMRM